MIVIGTGVDITEVSRLRRAALKWGNEFLNRVFTKQELAAAKSRASIYQHLAGRFAAKEAIFKALNDKHLSWKDIQIINNKEGKPVVEMLNSKGRDMDIQISISHVKNYAVANAIITQKD